MPGHPFYSTTKWRQLRKRVKTIWRAEGWPCGFCDQPLDWTVRMGVIVDHRLNRRERPDLALVQSNLMCVHHACNSKKAAWVEKERDIPQIGVDGFPVDSDWS